MPKQESVAFFYVLIIEADSLSEDYYAFMSRKKGDLFCGFLRDVQAG